MKDLRKTAEEILTKHENESFLNGKDKNFEKCISDTHKARINAMLEMYQLDRPKPIPFDANDPSTFPKEMGLYWIKINGNWYIDYWVMEGVFPDHSNHWKDTTQIKFVTHYAEISMPEE